MTCAELFSAIERLELCTGSEILAMAKHFEQCEDCRQTLQGMAEAYEHALGCDHELTELLTQETLQRARRAQLDPEITRDEPEATTNAIPPRHY